MPTLAGARVVLVVLIGRRASRAAHRRTLTIAEQVETDAPELAAAGWHIEEILPTAGDREVRVVGVPDERAAADFFAARYGSAGSVRWLGPNRFLERLHPFGSWASHGTGCAYYALDPNGEQPGSIRLAEENDERIVIALSSLDPVAVTRTMIAGFHPNHADVELREPVGNRVAIGARRRCRPPALAFADTEHEPGRLGDASLSTDAGRPSAGYRLPCNSSAKPWPRSAS